jgi:uncharacterized membrane protein required for colicin V production
MSNTAKYGHWFLLASLFAQAMFFGHLASTDYALGRVFGFARAYPREFWFLVLGGLLVCLLGFLATAAVLVKSRWSKQSAALFCLAAVAFILARVHSDNSRDWRFASELCILPATVLGYLAFDWLSSRPTPDKAVQPS